MDNSNIGLFLAFFLVSLSSDEKKGVNNVFQKIEGQSPLKQKP
jgi:hypothetical protein